MTLLGSNLYSQDNDSLFCITYGQLKSIRLMNSSLNQCEETNISLSKRIDIYASKDSVYTAQAQAYKGVVDNFN